MVIVSSTSERLLIKNSERNTDVAVCAEIAETSSSRRRGLLGRKSLGNGEGLWIVPCESVHTIGMQFPIDVLFLSRDYKVLKIRANMGPWKMAMCWRAQSVLELPAGTAAATQTRCGDRLEMTTLHPSHVV